MSAVDSKQHQGIVFRRIHGRIVPIRQKEDALSRIETNAKKAAAIGGTAGGASYAGFESIRRWLGARKKEVAQQIIPFRSMRPAPFTRIKPTPPWDDVGKTVFHMDDSPMARIAREGYNKELNAFKYAKTKSAKLWKTYMTEAKPVLAGRAGLRFRHFQLGKAERFVAGHTLKATAAIGAAAAIGAFAYYQLKKKDKR
jgi:hypothetical protein